MREFTLADLRRIMRACAGEDVTVNLDGDIEDVEFTDLGYDSLALLELCSRVELEFEVAIPDEAIGEIATPRQAVGYFNERVLTGR